MHEQNPPPETTQDETAVLNKVLRLKNDLAVLKTGTPERSFSQFGGSSLPIIIDYLQDLNTDTYIFLALTRSPFSLKNIDQSTENDIQSKKQRLAELKGHLQIIETGLAEYRGATLLYNSISSQISNKFSPEELKEMLSNSGLISDDQDMNHPELAQISLSYIYRFSIPTSNDYENQLTRIEKEIAKLELTLSVLESIKSIVDDIAMLQVPDQKKQALLVGITLGQLGITTTSDFSIRNYLENNPDINQLFLHYFPSTN